MFQQSYLWAFILKKWNQVLLKISIFIAALFT